MFELETETCVLVYTAVVDMLMVFIVVTVEILM